MFQLDELLKLKPSSKDIEHMNALPNDRIGNTPYVIEKTIHRSNDAFVYLVRHSVTDQLFVVKEFFPMVDFEYMSIPMRVSRKNGYEVVLEEDTVESLRVFTNLKKYYREAAVYIKRMNSHHLPQVIDYFELNNTVYVVLEYLPYPTLEELMSVKPMMVNQVMGLYGMLLNGVSQIHQEGYIIKSLSPSNIYITDKKVIFGDFNPLKRSYFISGNSNDKYVAPEILSNDILSEATDCYSLGRILEYLMGHVGYYQGAKLDNSKQFKPAVVEYLMKALTDDLQVDRIQTVQEIKVLLNHKVIDKSRRIEVLKIFLACFLVIVAIAMVRKSGIIDMMPWPSESDVEEIVETGHDEIIHYDFVTKRSDFDFDEKMVIRWFDKTHDGNYYISIRGRSEFEGVTSNQYFDFTGLCLNPGLYVFEVKNSGGEVISMDLEINEDLRTCSILQPEIKYKHYAYNLGETYEISWQSNYMTRIVVTDLTSADVIYDIKTDQKKISLEDLGLERGNYLILLQSVEDDCYSIYCPVFLDVYEKGEIKTPIVYCEDQIEIGEYIMWSTYEEGDINVRFVHESGKIYEGVYPAVDGRLLLDSSFDTGSYKVFMTYTCKEKSSKVVDIEIKLVD